MHTSGKFLPALFLLIGNSLAHAVPITFTDSDYTTFASAEAGDASDGPFSDASPTALPFGSTATAIGTDGDSASANAIVDSGVLVATTEAIGASAFGSATAVSTFSGRFDVMPGTLDWMLDFATDNVDTDSDAFAGGSLSITLEVDGVVLIDEVLAANALFDTNYIIANGGSGLLDLTLTSVADAASGQTAFNLATANFALNATPIPEPSTAVLALAGLAGIGWRWRAAANPKLR